jgi:glutamyl/glutaminyl-tRNA synthetase
MAVAETVLREAGQDFIRDIVRADLESGRRTAIVTRFPPEPNGYLHIGHAKSICLNFGIAEEFAGHCNLRFDDTNPAKESQEYIDAIEADVRWLGYDWGKNLYYASDYFERLYGWAEDLIRAGKAYVDDQSQDEMRAARGTLTEPGRNSPFRDRTVEENLDLFRRMRRGIPPAIVLAVVSQRFFSIPSWGRSVFRLSRIGRIRCAFVIQLASLYCPSSLAGRSVGNINIVQQRNAGP